MGGTAHRGGPDVRIVGARWYWHRASHVPGAVVLDVDYRPRRSKRIRRSRPTVTSGARRRDFATVKRQALAVASEEARSPRLLRTPLVRVPHERLRVHTQTVQYAVDEVEVADAVHCV